MGFFDRPIFDFNEDGVEDAFETFAGLQLMASSRQEAINLTGDDTFYMGPDRIGEGDEVDIELELSGLDFDDLESMDADECREALEDAGLDFSDFGGDFDGGFGGDF